MNQDSTIPLDAPPRTSTRRIGCFALGVLTGFICSVVAVIALANFLRPDVHHYKGQGEIDVIGTPIVTPGYIVEFTPFDLGKRAAMKFDVAGLPKNQLQWPLFAVNVLSIEAIDFDQDEGRSRKGGDSGKFTGTLHLRLTNHDGPVIFDVEAPIDKWIAHEGNSARGGLYKYELYFMDTNAGIEQTTSVDPKLITHDAHLTFEIEYEPGERPIDAIGIPIIRSGGYL